MQYYKTLNKNTIQCLLCRHYCKLKEGQTGICGVNKNENNELKNLVYNHPSALNIDPVEKKPLYHFLPGSKILSIGTVGCNFRCPFCQNWQISQTNKINENVVVTPKDMVNLVTEYQCIGVAYTYNEPSIFYPYAKDIAKLIALKGTRNIFVTDGFESIEEIEDMDWLDATNIDLKSFNKEYYKKVLKGDLDAVLDTIKRMHNKRVWIEITTLLIEGENNSDEELENMAKFIASVDKNIPWHLSAFHPDYKILNKNVTQIETLKRAYNIGKKQGLNYIYFGNINIPDITYCPECGYDIVVRNRYEVIKNEITDKGNCPRCNTPIAGVWNK